MNKNIPQYIKKIDIYLRDSDGYKIKDILVNSDEITAETKWKELNKIGSPPYTAYQWKERYEKI